MKLNLLIFYIIFTLSNNIFAQNDEPELAINLLANDRISEVNVVDGEKFAVSIAQITNYCKNNLKKLPKTQKIGILVIVHKVGQPSYKCYGNPKIDKYLENKILKDLSELDIVNTKIVDFPIFISFNSKGSEEVGEFDGYIDPTKQKFTEYENADLAIQLKLNKEYAINEAIPVLNAYQVIVDEKFASVKNFGKLIQTTNFNQKQNIDNIINANQDYWRAILEMEQGNQLISITKVFALVSQGELDYAKKYLEILEIFSNPKTITQQYLGELNYRIDIFNQQLNKKIKEGIVQHDKGEYQKAIDVYNEILKIYPNSSWALYEKYYSENAKKMAENKIATENRKDWDIAKVEIYKHNPLYSMDVRANNGKEAYLLFRRQEMANLFTKKDNILKDVFKYAEIATDLGVYDFAAQLFWLSASFDKDNFQDSIDNYLYCLDKLGEKEIKSNFKGDFDKVFKKIKNKKENEMKASKVYKAMKN